MFCIFENIDKIVVTLIRFEEKKISIVKQDSSSFEILTNEVGKFYVIIFYIIIVVSLIFSVFKRRIFCDLLQIQR